MKNELLATTAEMPAELPVKGALDVVHPEYSAKSISEIDALYDARIFSKERRNWLTPRNADLRLPGYLNSRAASSAYTAHFASKIDDILGEIVADRPRILFNAEVGARGQYWESLNADCNGVGKDFNAVVCEALHELLCHGRAYLTLKIPVAVAMPEGTTLYKEKQAGLFDFRIDSMTAEQVDDWDHDESGALIMLRRHCVDLVRPAPYLPPTKELHTWTFFRPDAVYKYQAERIYNPAESAAVSRWDYRSKATLKSTTPNRFGIIPVFPLSIRDGYSLGHRLIGPARALFNAEAARMFAVEAGALNQPVLATEKTASQVFLNEFGCVLVGIGGSFSWASPSKDVFDSLKSQQDDLRALFNSAAIQQADPTGAQPQNARQSAKAKLLDKSAKRTLLSTYAEPVRDALERIISMITAMRVEEDLEPRLAGLYDGRPDSTDVLDDAQALLELNPPATARRAALRECIYSSLPNLSQSEKVQIERELLTLTTNPPAVIVSKGD